MHTEAINHDPAITFMQTGSQLAGPAEHRLVGRLRPGQRERGPAGVRRAHLASARAARDDQPLYDRLWGSGFLPTKHQGVKFRNAGDPVLYLSNPPGVDRETRREMLDDLAALNQQQLRRASAIRRSQTRIAQYEMAFRMQASVPELTDISKEPQSVLDMYGPEVKTPGTFAANCLLARRLAERGVRFVQLFHIGWDHHGNLPDAIRGQCRDTDQPTAALIKDLKQRGLLDDTLVIWGGEFGRTVYSQGALTDDNYGRDHHPRCFTMLDGRRRHQGRARPTARPTTSATTSSETPSTSTTSTPPSCTCSASTTPSSPTASRAATSASPTCDGKVVKALLA